MSTLLYISASPRGKASDSNVLASAFLESYRKAHPGDEVKTLDLWDGSLPRFGPTGASAKMKVFDGQTLSEEEAAAWNQAKKFAEQFAAADRYLFSVPMWNLGIPYALKQWIDIVTQPGIAFKFDVDQGYMKVLHGKKAAAIYTSSVYYQGAPASYSLDFQSTYLKEWLRVTGVDDLIEIRFQPIYLTATPDKDRDAAVAAACKAGEAF
jgi:FMN-dependent NADH-azoreductase